MRHPPLPGQGSERGRVSLARRKAAAEPPAAAVPKQPSSPRGRARKRRRQRTGTRQQACGISRPVRNGFSRPPQCHHEEAICDSPPRSGAAPPDQGTPGSIYTTPVRSSPADRSEGEPASRQNGCSAQAERRDGLVCTLRQSRRSRTTTPVGVGHVMLSGLVTRRAREPPRYARGLRSAGGPRRGHRTGWSALVGGVWHGGCSLRLITGVEALAAGLHLDAAVLALPGGIRTGRWGPGR
jgi:hypothetical protein